MHLLLNPWQITIFVDTFVFIDKEILMLLRKCLILLALFSFSAAPMMGCTPAADDAGGGTENTGDADSGEAGDDAGTDDETENGNDTNS